MIGRSQFADIVTADTSVAPRHAELVVTDDGRFHLTDCASGKSTWRWTEDGGGEPSWQGIRQSFVGPDDALRLGDHPCTVRDLLRQVTAPEGSDTNGRWRPEAVGEAGSQRLRGRVERDPVTGEVVRKRL